MQDERVDASGSGGSGGSAAAAVAASIPSLSSMEDVVALINQTSPSPSSASVAAAGQHISPHIRETLLPALQKLLHSPKGRGERVLLGALQGGVDPLSALDSKNHTLGTAYILALRCLNAPDGPVANGLAPHVEKFGLHFMPEQLVGAGEIVTMLAKGFAAVGQLIGDPMWALISISRVFDGFRAAHGNLNNFTTLHPIFVYQCLRTRHYNMAVDWVLQHELTDASRDVTPLSYTDVLEYFYYGGLAFAKLGNFEKAVEFFEVCVSSPAQQASAIQIDAYKKLLLVQLIAHGKTSKLPRYTSSSVTRAIKGQIAHLGFYTSLVDAYEARFLPQMDREGGVGSAGLQARDRVIGAANAGAEAFSRDMNVGLVQHVVSLHRLRLVRQLANSFETLALGDIARLVGGLEADVEEGDESQAASKTALEDIREIAARGWIQVSLQEASPLSRSIVRFSPLELSKFDGLDSIELLTKTMSEAKRWDQIVEARERAVARSEAFLTKAQANGSSRDRFGAGGGGGGMSIDDYDEDESFS